ncbi:hypothetical protein WG66_009537 [Moniliophthora roreri]|nr:hypothetical protein WG66_009537 [Moniliophthora roreri]
MSCGCSMVNGIDPYGLNLNQLINWLIKGAPIRFVSAIRPWIKIIGFRSISSFYERHRTWNSWGE